MLPSKLLLDDACPALGGFGGFGGLGGLGGGDDMIFNTRSGGF